MSDSEEIILNFDTSATPVGIGNSGTIPSGEYLFEVMDVKSKTITQDYNDPNSTKGQRLSVTLRVDEGDHENRRIFDDFDVHTPWDAERQKKARSRLNALLTGAGMPGETRMGALLGVRVIGKVAEVKAKTADRKDRNYVNEYRPPSGAAPAASVAPAKKAPGFMANKPRLA